MLELYLGGARSGKSAAAERRACSLPLNRIYVATATAGDPEMTARIAHHQQQREGQGWQTLEAPELLAETLDQHAAEDRCIMVDCLTLWLSNWLCKDNPDQWRAVRKALLDTLASLPGHIILVSNEVGQGIVPMGALTRQFVDEAGRLHQSLAAMADRVVFVTAGIEQVLKGK